MGLPAAQQATPPCSSPFISAISEPCNTHREMQKCPFSNLFIGSLGVIFRIGAPGSRACRLLCSYPPTCQVTGLSLRFCSRFQKDLFGGLWVSNEWCLSISTMMSKDKWGRDACQFILSLKCLCLSPAHFPDLGLGHPHHLCPGKARSPPSYPLLYPPRTPAAKPGLSLS